MILCNSPNQYFLRLVFIKQFIIKCLFRQKFFQSSCPYRLTQQKKNYRIIAKFNKQNRGKSEKISQKCILLYHKYRSYVNKKL